MAFKTFTFNGTVSSAKGVYVSTFPSYPVAAKVIETYQVPGRNGDIIFDEGTYKNVKMSYECSVWNSGIKPELSNLVTAIQSVVSWLHPSALGYCTLRDEYYPGGYRLAICENELEFANLLMTVGTARVTFNCRPEFYYDNSTAHPSTTTLNNNSQTVSNSTSFISRPTFVATGPQTITINSGVTSKYSRIVISNVEASTVVTIDGDTLDATTNNGQTYVNDKVSITNVPKLYSGNNTISSTGRVTVYHRWWTL